jgi:HK97 family phage prohead protease
MDDASTDGSIGLLTGHFSTFGSWYEVDSVWEGRFLERVEAGSFKKTFAENRDAMRVTFNHGADPQLGDKVLGPISVLEEDSTGPRYEVPLFDTSYNRDLLPGLKAKVYGSSFRFRVVRDELAEKPKRADHNPEGIPERTIKEVQVMEFGPVTYPANPEATAGIRSLTDFYVFDRFASKPERLRELIASAQVPAPSDDADPLVTSKERRGAPSMPPRAVPRFRSLEEFNEWLHSQTSAS